MKRIVMGRGFLFGAIAAAMWSTVASAEPARRMTLSECIDTALRQNPDVTASRFDIEASEAAHSAAVGNYGPKLNVGAGVQLWDRVQTLDLSSSMAPLVSWIYGNFASLQAPNPNPPNMGPMEVRSRTTWNFTVTLAQPLASLWTIDEGAKLRSLGVDVAKIESETIRRDTAYQVIEGYYRVLQAERLEEVAAQSVEQVESQVKRAEAFYRQGTVGKNDVLRAQLGLAAAKQKKISAGGLVTLAQAKLGTVMGLPSGAGVEPAATSAEVPPSLALTSEQAESLAVGRREELREIDRKIEQAEHSVSLSKSKMLPQVNAVAQYAHNEGSAFQQINSAFVGGTLSWDIWENGATYYGISEARSRLAQAQALRKKAEDGLRLEAKNAFVNVTTSAEALAVAESAVVQAEENYRIENKRYEAAHNTSFDVLDAQTLLSNARAQREAALYDYVIARSALARATGQPASATTTEGAGTGAGAAQPASAVPPAAQPASAAAPAAPTPKAGLSVGVGVRAEGPSTAAPAAAPTAPAAASPAQNHP